MPTVHSSLWTCAVKLELQFNGTLLSTATGFFFEGVVRKIETGLLREVAFLQAYDAFASCIAAILDMPDSKISLLHKFLDQNGGKLSKRGQTKEFEGITAKEVQNIERLYAKCFSQSRAWHTLKLRA